MSKFDQKSPKGSVPNGQSKFANRYAIRWFKCKLKPPRNTKSEGHANSAFQKFLTKYGKENLDYWYYGEEELDSMLAKF